MRLHSCCNCFSSEISSPITIIIIIITISVVVVVFSLLLPSLEGNSTLVTATAAANAATSSVVDIVKGNSNYDDVILASGNNRFYASGSAIINNNYWVQKIIIEKDCYTQQQRSQVTLGIDTAYGSDIIATTSKSSIFNECGKLQPVMFSSSLPNTYSISSSSSSSSSTSAPSRYKANPVQQFTSYVIVSSSSSSQYNNNNNNNKTAPILNIPENKFVEATSIAGAIVFYTVSATDSTGHTTITPICSPPASGSLFPLGTTTVTCTATDKMGNTVTKSFTVTVKDTTPPTLTLNNITKEATGPSGSAVAYTATASDVVYGSITPICSKGSRGTVVTAANNTHSGSLFPLGTTTVTCTATDKMGNTVTKSFTVTVKDTTPPTLTFAVSNLIVKAESRKTPVSYSDYVSATDTIDGTITPICSPPASGSLFPLGTTTVTCTATDKMGNTVTKSFTVTVRYPFFSGFLYPINPDGSSIFKLGSTIPVKFQLKWLNGDFVHDAVAQIYSAKISNTVTGTEVEAPSTSSNATAPSSGNYFRYDPSNRQYMFNLATQSLSSGTWQIKILLDDGTSPTVNISLN